MSLPVMKPLCVIELVTRNESICSKKTFTDYQLCNSHAKYLARTGETQKSLSGYLAIA